MRFNSILLALGLPLLGVSSTTPSHDRGLMFGCSVVCETGCGVGGGYGHYATATGGYGGGIPHSDCYAGNSCNGHSCFTLLTPELVPLLGRELAASELLRYAAEAAAGSSRAVRQLRSQFGDLVEYNADRQALQIIGCNNQAIALHIPLTAEQVAAANE